MTMSAEIRTGVDRLASDDVSGATSIVLRAIELLRTAVLEGQDIGEVAAALVDAQPAMAGLRTAAAVATTSRSPEALTALAARVRRAPAAIAQLAAPLVRLRPPTERVLRVATCSRSGIVERTLHEIAAAGPVEVCCAVSEPRHEGALLAEALTAAGIKVELYSDAGISQAIPGVDALVVGADAVSSAGFINKVGTAALAALARLHAVPIFVLAGREKILPVPEFEALPLRGGRGGAAPLAPGSLLRIEDPWFERVPAAVGAALVTDIGAIPWDDAEKAGLRGSGLDRL